MYQISKFSNKIKSSEGIIFNQDELDSNYQLFINWLNEGNIQIFVNYFDEEYPQTLQPIIEKIDLEYTKKISDLMRKSIEQLIADNIPIPQTILDERNNLRNECNRLISELGIDVPIYRENKKIILL